MQSLFGKTLCNCSSFPIHSPATEPIHLIQHLLSYFLEGLASGNRGKMLQPNPFAPGFHPSLIMSFPML